MAFEQITWHRGGMTLRRPAAGLAAVLLTVSVTACASDSEPVASDAADSSSEATSSTESTPEDASSQESPTEKSTKKGSKPKAEPAVAPGAWIDYDAYQADRAAYADSDVVLFFAATWCYTCQAAEKSLDTDGVPDGLAVVKVDYDSQTDLRKKYGVTVQHTFVHIDDSGAALKKWSGSESGAAIQAEI